jgi:para-nitrobenzyl esterase
MLVKVMLSTLAHPPPGAPTVVTTGGIVWGAPLPASAGGAEVSQFLGVPFARAERWSPPVDFTGQYKQQPLNATMWGRACLQILDQGVSYGSEDCLQANVWKPAGATPQSQLPVLVFIYGGSNQFGEAEPYNMSGLAAFHNVVCVNFNYRTGRASTDLRTHDLHSRPARLQRLC